jgi:hypothetical protein
MKKKEIYIIDNLMINIYKYFYESDEMFSFRINYIYLKYEQYKNENKIKSIDINQIINDIINDSMIESNKKYNHVTY